MIATFFSVMKWGKISCWDKSIKWQQLVEISSLVTMHPKRWTMGEPTLFSSFMCLFIYLFPFQGQENINRTMKYQGTSSALWPSVYQLKYLCSFVWLNQGKRILSWSIFDQFVRNMQILDVKRLYSERNEYFYF